MPPLTCRTQRSMYTLIWPGPEKGTGCQSAFLPLAKSSGHDFSIQVGTSKVAPGPAKWCPKGPPSEGSRLLSSAQPSPESAPQKWLGHVQSIDGPGSTFLRLLERDPVPSLSLRHKTGNLSHHDTWGSNSFQTLYSLKPNVYETIWLNTGLHKLCFEHQPKEFPQKRHSNDHDVTWFNAAQTLI